MNAPILDIAVVADAEEALTAYQDLLADPEIALPARLLEQLAADHVIGSAATGHISVMGYQERSLEGWRDKTSGEVIAHLRSQGVDGLILAPA